MKKSLLFISIFLFFCGLFAANASPDILQNSSHTDAAECLNPVADPPPPSVYWFESFESCPATGNCTPEDPIYGKMAKSNNVSFIACQYAPADPSFHRPKSGDKFATIAINNPATFGEYGYITTPGFPLKKDTTYTYSFWYNASGSNWLRGNGYYLKIMVGDRQDIATMTEVLDSFVPLETYYKQYKLQYTPTQDGTFYFCVVAGETKRNTVMDFTFTMDDFEVTKLPNCPEPKEPTASAAIGALNLKWNNTGVNKYAIDYKKYKEGNSQFQTVYTTDTAFRLGGLGEATDYSIAVRSICGADTSIQSPQLPIYTYAKPDTIPLVENFEDPANNKWIFVHRMYKQTWTIGSSTYSTLNGASGNRSLYSYNSADWKNPSDTSYKGWTAGDNAINMFAYRDIVIPEGLGFALSIKFDYMGNGFSAGSLSPAGYVFNRLSGDVYLLDEDVVIREGMVFPDSVRIKSFTVAPADWATIDIRLSDYEKYAGKKKRLVFGWMQTGMSGGKPLAIDNLIVSRVCPSLGDILFKGFEDQTKIKLEWVSTGNNFEVAYKTIGNPTWSSTISTSNNYYTIPSLLHGTSYDIRVRRKCTETDFSEWKEIKITTPQQAKTVPFSEDFDSVSHGNDWIIVNGIPTNRWYIKDTIENYRAFISNNGINYQYSELSNPNKVRNVVHLYRDISFPVTDKEFLLSFDWKAMGDMYNDYLRVSLVDVDDVNNMPYAGTLPTAKVLADLLYKKEWTRAQIVLNAAEFSGKTKRLMFTWINDGVWKGGIVNRNYAYPAAIDNIKIDTLACSPTQNIITSLPSADSIKLEWNSNAPTLTLKYRGYSNTVPPEDWITTICTENQFKLGNLPSNKLFEFVLQMNCNGSSYDTAFTVRTLQIPVAVNPFFEDFQDNNSAFNWTGTTVNLLYPDHWTIGRGANLFTDDPSEYRAYITNDLPPTADINLQTDHGNTAYYYFYRDINIPSNTKECELSFNWKAGGNSKKILYAYLANVNTVLDPYTGPKGVSSSIARSGSATAWTKETVYIPVSTQGVKRLVFAWKVDSLSAIQPPAAIDNVSLWSLNTETPRSLNVKNALTTSSSLTIGWNSATNTNDSNFIVSYKEESSTHWNNDTFKITLPTRVYTIDALLPNTSYQIRLKANALGNVAWAPTITGLTAQEVENTPFIEKFDDSVKAAQWTFVQGNQKNKLYVGPWGRKDSNGDTTCLYVDSEGGTENTYDPQAKSVSHFYRDIAFGNDSVYTISFDWKNNGSSTALVKVFVVETTTAITAGTPLTANVNFLFESNSFGSPDWTRTTATLGNGTGYYAVRNKTKRVVFSWDNSVSSISNQPPTCIDNIEIKGASCTFPTNLKLSGKPYYDSLKIAWDSPLNNFEIQYRAFGENNWIDYNEQIEGKNATLKNLNENTTYEIQARAACVTSGFSAWSSTLKAATALRVKELPIADDFSKKELLWMLVNGSQPNKWTKGAAAGNVQQSSNESAIYISNNGGVSHQFAYSNSTTHFYSDIVFPNAPQYLLSFSWKNSGIPDYALKVFLVDTSVTPKEGSSLTATPLHTLSDSRFWLNDSTLFPDTLGGKTKRLVFSWSSLPYVIPTSQPPAAVDDIKFTALSCITPSNLNAKCLVEKEANLSWSANSDNNFTVYYRKKGTSVWDSVVNRTNPTTLQNLDMNAEYEYRVLNTCGKGTELLKSEIANFTTLQNPATIPFYEDFQIPAQNAQWTTLNGINHWVIDINDSLSGKYLYVRAPDYKYNRYIQVYSDPRKFSYAFRDIKFNDSPEGFRLMFGWVNEGLPERFNSDRDNLQVFLVDRDFELDLEKDIPQRYLLSSKRCYGVLDKFVTESIFIPAEVSNKTKRLVFRWANTYPLGFTTYMAFRSAMVNEIRLDALDCKTPASLKANQTTLDSVTITWDASLDMSYKVEYGETDSSRRITTTLSKNSFGLNLADLAPGTSYTVKVTPDCSNSVPAEITFSTPLRLTIFEDFDTVLPKQWKNVYGVLSLQENTPTDLYISSLWTNDGVSDFPPKWVKRNFMHKKGAGSAASIGVYRNSCNAWMISPDIYLDESSEPIEISFKLGMAHAFSEDQDTIPTIDATVGEDDKFGIFISDDDKWNITDTLAFWSNNGIGRSFQKISNAEQGERITISLQGRKGRFKIAFYAESTVANARNTIFVDSLLIRRPNCEPVSKLKISDITHSSAKPTWTGDYYQKDYQISWNLQTNPAEKGNIFVNTANAQIASLLPSKTYNAMVRGICKIGDTSAWSQISFKTASNCSDIAGITSIPDSNSAAISWSSNGANKVGYQYCYATADKTVSQLTPTFTTDTNFKATGLTTVTNYVVYIRPICSLEDTGSWSSHNFRTLKLHCGVPAAPSVASITSTSAKSHCIAAYRSSKFEFRYGSNETIANMQPIVTNETSVPITGLAPASTYYCAIRAICGIDDTSTFSPTSQFTTLACTNVKDINVAKDGEEAIIVTWKTEGGQSRWEILLIPDGKTENAKIIPTTDSVKRINRSEFPAGTTHTVQVRTVCGTNYSSYSNNMAVPLGISNTLSEGVRISVSPNPATTHTKLSIESLDGNVKVELFNIRGELITSEMLNCNIEITKELSLRGLAKGTYTIRITHEKWVETEKLIVN